MINCEACGNEGVIDGLDFKFEYKFTEDGNVFGVITCMECGKSLTFDIFDYIDFDGVVFHASADNWED